MAWSRLNIEPPSGTHIAYPETFHANLNPTVQHHHFDLAVMSACDHSIYNFGSFGFWGAALANGRKICAEKFCQNDNGQWTETALKSYKEKRLPWFKSIPVYKGK